jgi:Ni,Fe-hydrogenase maturation factor
MKNKILCLGNEFVKEDSFAKKIGEELAKEGFEVVNVKDSFQLMGLLKENNEVIILDVVLGLENVRIIGVRELTDDKIMTAHDFDASFVLKLFEDKDIKIIGVPMNGEISQISEIVKEMLCLYSG